MNLWNFKALFYHQLRRIWPLSRILHIENENVKKMLSKIPLRNGSAVDLGCGTGNSFKIIRSNQIIIGLDKSIRMTRYVHKKLKKDVVVADVLQLPFKKESISFFMAVGLTEYLKDLVSFFDQVRFTAAPESFLLLSSSPPSWVTNLRKIGGNKIYKRRMIDVQILARDYGFNALAHRCSPMQELCLFRRSIRS